MGFPTFSMVQPYVAVEVFGTGSRTVRINLPLLI